VPTGDADEADLAMSRYADGDDTAFPVVHRAVARRLRAFLARMAGSTALAEDLTQETFLRVHRARGSFERGARLLPWCYSIARNVYVDHVRRRSAREGTGPLVEVGTANVAGGADGEQMTAAAELADIVSRTLARLPADQREAFVLVRYEGLSMAEAAGVVGATEGAVKIRAFHAYEALRAALGEVAPKKRGTS